MSVITEDFRRLDGVAPFPADLAFVYFTVPRRRENAAGTWVVVPVEVKCRLVGGQLTSPNLDPGEATVRIGPHGPTYKIIIPATDARLWDLIEMYEIPDPPVVSLVKQYLEDTKEARDIAVAAAEGVAGIGEDLEQIAQDRAAAEAARDAAQGFAGSASESSGHAAVSAVSAGDSATLAGQRDTSAAGHASNASASATAAGQSEAAAAQHKEDAEGAADLAVQTAAGIQDVAEDAAQVATDRQAVESAASAVATDRQTVTTAHDVVVAAQTDVEQIQTDVHQTKSSIENTSNLVDQTLAQYGTQFVAERELSQQAVTDATAQAQRAEDAADGIVAGSVLDNAVTTPKLADEAVTKAKTSPAVQASLDKADGSVQGDDPRLTDARPPTTHTHAESQVTGLTAKLATKADLDSNGVLVQSQIPAVAIRDFLGAVSTQSAMLALIGQKGDWCTRSDRGSDFQIIGNDPTQLSSWRENTYPASPVSSVNGRQGAVTTQAVDITDSTAVGRAVMKAADAAAGRLALGVDAPSDTRNPSPGSVTIATMASAAKQDTLRFGLWSDTRKVGTGDGFAPDGWEFTYPVTVTGFKVQLGTADASGASSVVQMQKNAVDVAGASVSIAAGTRTGSATGTFAFAAGDVLTFSQTAAGTTPGKRASIILSMTRA
ncbi:hypothetical protein QM716_01160 [Rhodococcus sp. IEGM 1409]|uniref:hypothetical protein n=1 Tax=Rhodococcus sp. IEGM 1409 TaxID=3047082 RepID=UPI0024B8693C|nr:hypothetical protein [Rhodococcus sp. IEGM 1409]MDI9898456.1 hypothetical protein [Rhodococcus sp. IEGM 1409]